MRTRTCLALALAAGLASRAAAGEAPPKVLLHLPFDGSADAAFCVTGRRKTSYVEMAYGPGKKGQAANIGSERYPCGLVVRGRDLFDKQAGSFAVWYKPLWNPEEDREHAATRTLVTDGKPALGVGHFWITLAGKAVHFAWRGRQARGVSAPIARWRKGTWHHIVATWDSAEGIALYIDGERGARRQMRWQLPPSDTLYIGANRRGLNRAEGLLDELYLYDRALSAAEVERAYVQNLPTARPSIRRPQPPPPAREPRLTLHLPFDGSPTAKTAGGKAEPETAEGAEFTNGLRGKALVCSEGLDLAYAFEKNVSKAAGAVTFWARSSFVASAPRGILLADEQPAASEEEQRANTLGLWLQRADLARVEDKVVARPRIPTLHFDMLPQRLQRPLFRWSKADWYHVAVCWRQGREVALYVNGELAARRAARSLTWSESPSRLLHVGSWGGKMPADAVIDELKVYDAPLAADQIRQDAARFLLPLSLKLRHTLFLRGQPADLVIDAVNISPQPFEGEVTVQVANPGGQAIASVTEALQVEPKASAPIALKLDAKALAHEGLYPISTSSPKRVNTPVAYFLVVPERAPAEPVVEPQPERKLLETIELGTLEEGAARLVHSGRSTIQEAAGAQCRQAGPRRDDRFAVRFTVKEPGEPHVVVVTYPDDRPRSAEIVINSESFPHTLDVATGYFTTEGGTDKLLELPLYFWPRERDHALIVRTLGTGRPAACATIAVHQLQGGLPPTRTQTPADGGRPVGLWWRKPSVPLQFGARQLLAPDVYASFGRLADYAAFAGQNLIGYPLAWNTGTLYPSPGESFRQGSGGDRHCSDWVQYALHH
ncbi:MAG: LamG-like jellyroll fold domain-containing protein, partial [bacterium]